MTVESHPQPVPDAHGALNRRLEDIGWGLFLIVIGSIWLVPEPLLPRGTWIIAAGVVMLGVNAVRYMNGIRINGFTTGLGVLAVIAGAAGAAGLNLPLFPIVLVVIGLMLLARPLLGMRRTS
ncbi:MAG: hypothetical protein ACXV5L_07355 [Thermoanaerobaculia bacterium]